jgi:hypothetical protein
MEEESTLEELKKDYEKLKKAYKLPEFRQLNEDFDIEKVAQHETDYALREVRRQMMDKVISYLRFIEMLLNPSNAPIFFFAAIKGFTSSDKKLVEKIYENLGEFEIGVIALDSKYSESKEAEFIKKLSSEWRSISEDMLNLSEILKKNWKQKSGHHDRGYCG